MRILTLTLCALLALTAPGVVHAVSAQATTATLRGVVRDVTGGVVPGATVTVLNTQTSATRATPADQDGRYELAGLPAGPYRVEAALPGFAPSAATLTLAADATRTFDFTIEPAIFLESVTVTRADERQAAVPQPVTVITKDAIQFAQRRDSLAESISGTPGLFMANRRNYGLSGGVNAAVRAPMMGFDMRGVQILQDGVPLTTADGTTQPTNVDLGSAGRIDIVRGPSSVLYGNAAGGVISVRTEFPSSAPLMIEPDIQMGSFGYERLQLKVGGTSGRLSYLANVSRMEVDGYRQHSRAEVRRANVIVRHLLSPDTEIRGVFNLYDMPFGENPSSLTRSDARDVPTSTRPQAFTQGWGESATQGQGGVTVEHALEGDGPLIRVTGWGQWRDVWNPVPFRLIDLGRKAGGVRAELSGETTIGPRAVSWTSGLDLSFQRDERREYTNGGVPPGGTMTTPGDQLLEQDEAVTSIAPFVQARVAIDDRWSVTGGLRYDYLDFSATDRFLSDGDQTGGRTLDAVSPMVGVTFEARENLHLYSNYATAYQTPTTVELSNQSTGEGGFNDQLEPENLRSFEIGARGNVPDVGLGFEVATYFSTLDNAFVELQRADEQTYFANAAQASRNGLEMRLDWAARPGLSAWLSYTYQDFTFDEFQAGNDDLAGNKEPGAPPHQFFLGGRYLTENGVRASAQMRWVGDYVVNNANSVSNWAYTVFDVTLGWDGEWRGVRVQPFLGIENLFDERYNMSTISNALGNRFFEPAPGREFYIGVTLGAGLF